MVSRSTARAELKRPAEETRIRSMRALSRNTRKNHRQPGTGNLTILPLVHPHETTETLARLWIRKLSNFGWERGLKLHRKTAQESKGRVRRGWGRFSVDFGDFPGSIRVDSRV